MSVFFAYRCPYCPGGLHRKRFEQDSVLDWFAAHWAHLTEAPKQAAARAEALLGCEVYSFPQSFQEAAEEGLPAPADLADLESFMSHGYVPDAPLVSEHAVQVCTDDDEVGLAYSFFDGHYLQEQLGLASFLALDDWRLPAGRRPAGFVAREPTVLLPARGGGEGTTYIVDLDRVGDMDELCDAYRLEGVRLPALANFLAGATLTTQEEPDLSYDLLTLRALLAAGEAGGDPLEAAFLEEIRARPEDPAAWHAYSDWLLERGGRPAGLHLLHRPLTRAGVWLDEGLREKLRERWYWLDDGFREMLPKGTRRAPWQPVTLQDAYTRLEDLSGALDGLVGKSRSEVHVEDHVAQLSLHVNTWTLPRRVRHVYHQWVLFDDLWAGAHPALANAILRFVRRWDVLSPRDTGEGDSQATGE